MHMTNKDSSRLARHKNFVQLQNCPDFWSTAMLDIVLILSSNR